MQREKEIKEIAYHIWEQDGCLHGNSLRYWVQAEMIWESRQKTPPPETSEDNKTEGQPELPEAAAQPAQIKTATATPRSTKLQKRGNK